MYSDFGLLVPLGKSKELNLPIKFVVLGDILILLAFDWSVWTFVFLQLEIGCMYICLWMQIHKVCQMCICAITLKCVQSISDAITFAAAVQPQGQSRVFSCPLCILCCMPACYMCVWVCIYTSLKANHLMHTNYVVVFALIDLILIGNVSFVQWTRKGMLISVLMR